MESNDTSRDNVTTNNTTNEDCVDGATNVLEKSNSADNIASNPIDENHSDVPENEEDMKARQAKELDAVDLELKEKLSHVGKKNRKRKKLLWAEANAAIERLKEQHSLQLQEAGFFSPSAEPVPLEATNVESSEASISVTKKKSKAQRRREKKLAEERARKEALRLAKSSFVSGRDIEMQQLNAVLKLEGFKVHDIAADGHCLFRAVEHQLRYHSVDGAKLRCSYDELRILASKHMIANRHDYEPFFDNAESKNPKQTFLQYCQDMATSATWGGQLELRALSELLERPIHVYKASGPVTKMGEQFTSASQIEPLRISHHEHYYALGEHYNSII